MELSAFDIFRDAFDSPMSGAPLLPEECCPQMIRLSFRLWASPLCCMNIYQQPPVDNVDNSVSLVETFVDSISARFIKCRHVAVRAPILIDMLQDWPAESF